MTTRDEMNSFIENDKIYTFSSLESVSSELYLEPSELSERSLKINSN